MINSLSTPLKWEAPRPNSTLPLINKPLPYRIKEREEIAGKISYDALFSMNDMVINKQYQRQCKWKSLRHLFYITRQKAYVKHSFERVMYSFGSLLVPMEFFVSAVMAEYAFPRALKMDAHLKWLYWAFDTQRSNQVDWRDINAHYKFLLNFRYIREHTLELMLLLFDVYTEGGDPDSKAVKDDFVIESPIQLLDRVLFLPCELDQEVARMEPYLAEVAEALRAEGHTRRVTRRQLQLLLQGRGAGADLLSAFASLSWDRLSTELRLTILDESQLYHQDQAEVIIGRYKLSQALMLYHRNILKTMIRDWRSVTLRSTGARIYLFRKNLRHKRRAVRFWFWYAHRRAVRRKRRFLAEVMGAYAIKARCFQRIKIFNENVRRIESVVGSLHKKARLFRLAGSHLREYDRLRHLKAFYHRWWNLCVEENNVEVAEQHNRKRHLRRCLRPWFHFAHERAYATKQDLIARENKITFDRRMEETDAAFNELLRLEQIRNERIEKARQEAEEQERERKLEEYKTRIRMEKYTEKKLIESMQREERTKRINQQLKSLKKKFKKDWDLKEAEVILKAKERIAAYVGNKDNELAIDMKFDVVKREFFAFPTPETREREHALASYRNIMFLYIEAKIRYEGLVPEKIVTDYDHTKKGYLTFAELTKFIRTLSTCLNEAQITSAIRSTDRTKDKEVSIAELEAGLKHIQGRMGVLGSHWKHYIDPTEDVICYHNFQTGEKVLEYNMTDPVLRRIVIDDMYGAAEHSALAEYDRERTLAWEKVMKDYMARRLQFLYRYWKGRVYRKKKAWKVTKRIQREKTRNQRICARFLEKVFVARRARALFRKQLHLTVERLWDADSGVEFYYNHATGQSSWEKPWLLLRHGQVTTPCVWVPMEPAMHYRDAEEVSALVVVVEEGDPNQAQGQGFDARALLPVVDAAGAVIDYDPAGRGVDHALTISAAVTTAASAASTSPATAVVGYWHCKARRSVPFKPDGFLLCDRCAHSLAVHTCQQCNVHTLEDGRVVGGHFCFPCHRATHANPLGFLQCTKVSKKQYTDPTFLDKYKCFKHTWVDTEPHRCDMCKQTKLNAAFMCVTCKNKKMCRTCFHRIHAHDENGRHHYYNI